MIKFKALCIVFMFLLSCSVNAEEQVIVVKKGDAASLLEAIDQANKQNADPLSERIYILIPDGLYDLKTTVLTSITGYNISLVGQSMYFTVIRNAPSIEMGGIDRTATILNTGSGLRTVYAGFDLAERSQFLSGRVYREGRCLSG